MHTTPAVGQEVYITRSGTWNISHTLGKISKVTASGQITVDVPALQCGLVEIKFTPKGKEIGGSRWLSWNVTEIKAMLAEKARARNAGDQISKASKRLAEYRDTYGTDDAQRSIDEARELLNAAEAALKK